MQSPTWIKRGEDKMQTVRLTYDEFGRWREEIAALLNENAAVSFPDNHIDPRYGHKKCRDIEKFLKDGSAVIFLAMEDGALLGWIWCHEIWRFADRRLHVADLGTARHCRRKGIGSLLLEKAEEYAAANGFAGLDLMVTASNEGAVAFYKKAGYLKERYQMYKNIR